MKLPQELRDMIYKFALIQHERLIIQTPDSYRLPLKDRRSWHEPGLLHASKQLHREAKAIHYLCHAIEIRIEYCESTQVYLRLKRLSEQLDVLWPAFTIDTTVARCISMVDLFSRAKLAYESDFTVEQLDDGLPVELAEVFTSHRYAWLSRKSYNSECMPSSIDNFPARILKRKKPAK